MLVRGVDDALLQALKTREAAHDVMPGVLVRTHKLEKYGRMLADCCRRGEKSLCTELPEQGLASTYLP